MLSRLFCLFGFHSHTYRERRPLYSFDVLFLCCDSCNYAVPAIVREPEEYRSFWQFRTPIAKARKVLQPSAADRARVVESVLPIRRVK